MNAVDMSVDKEMGGILDYLSSKKEYRAYLEEKAKSL
jgi:hypothetical protein